MTANSDSREGYELRLLDAAAARFILLIPGIAAAVLSYSLGAEVSWIVGLLLSGFIVIVFWWYRGRILDCIKVDNELSLQCGKRLHVEKKVPGRQGVLRVIGNPWFILWSRAETWVPRLYFGSYGNTSRGRGKQVLDELRSALNS